MVCVVWTTGVRGGTFGDVTNMLIFRDIMGLVLSMIRVFRALRTAVCLIRAGLLVVLRIMILVLMVMRVLVVVNLVILTLVM